MATVLSIVLMISAITQASAAHDQAAQLANAAAGLAVARFGPVAITADELIAALRQV